MSIQSFWAKWLESATVNRRIAFKVKRHLCNLVKQNRAFAFCVICKVADVQAD